MATCPNTPWFSLVSKKLNSTKYLFGQFGSAGQVVSTPALLSTLFYLMGGRAGVKRALVVYKYCLAVVEMLVYLPASSHKSQKTAQHELLWRKWIPFKLDLVEWFT